MRFSIYAALNTTTGRVHGKTAARHTSREFVAFLQEVVSHYSVSSFPASASADAVLQLLGERPKRKGPSHLRVDESAAQLLLATADKMAAELMKGNFEVAIQLAHEYCEARES